MIKARMFNNYDEYETWTEKFEEASECEIYPTGIDDGWKVSLDMFTYCKSWKWALKRFHKVFSEVVDPDVGLDGWVECIRESCENGYFEDHDGWKPAWTTEEDEIKKAAECGTFSYEVQEVDDRFWYICLVISGSYANRERKIS